MIQGFRLHHVGIVVSDIEQSAVKYTRSLGYTARTDIIHDAVQTAFVQFLRHPGDHAYVELVSPDGPSSKLANALSKGGGLNHLCYSVSEIEKDCERLKSEGLMLIQPPVPATAFGGRRIAWFMGFDRLLVELVERGREGEL